MSYHQPVMLAECIDALAINPAGVYVDLTFGGGGHSKAILDNLTTGKLLAFDQDADAKANIEALQAGEKLIFVPANFRHLKRYLKLYGHPKVDGILADLGISSHQIDVPERGFSTRYDADLDMRMSQQGATAADLLNTLPEADLHKVLGMYGEVKNAKTLATALVSSRVNKPFVRINDLKEVLQRFAPRGKENKYFAQVFQALRIVVNDEMGALEEMLQQTAEVLKPKGRLVVISYHSLEDRMVKNFIAKGKVHGELEKDFYGNPIRPMEAITRKPIEASPEEIAQNPRARSAKLRIAEKI